MKPLEPEAKLRAGDVCKRCRESILWATTTNGKAIPIDAEPVYGGNVELDVDELGMLKARVVRPAGDVQAYYPHHATCEAVEYFRPGGAAEAGDQAPDHDEQLETKRRALQVRMPFGKYSGQTLEEIDRDTKGREYLRWAALNVEFRNVTVGNAVKLIAGVE